MCANNATLGWIRVDVWGPFHQQWWGENGRKRLDDALKSTTNAGRTIEVGSAAYELLDLLHDTGGVLFLRKEILDCYNRLKDTSQRSMSGVVLSGQPGIGKSTALAYFLLERLADRKTTFFTTGGRRIFRFDDSGISTSPGEHLPTPLPKADQSERIWSLIDADLHGQGPPSDVVKTWVFFPIHTVSLARKRYAWQKKYIAVMWIMQPWSWLDEGELRHCLSLDLQFQRLSQDEQEELISYAKHACGPCPRDILEVIVRGKTFVEGGMSYALHKLRLLIERPGTYSAERENIFSDVSEALFLLRGLTNNIGGQIKYDSSVLDFKSADVMNSVMKEFRIPDLAQFTTLIKFNFFSFIPEVSVLGGWIFESLATCYMTNGGSMPERPSVFGPLQRMTQISDGQFSDSTFVIPGHGPGFPQVICDSAEGALILTDHKIVNWLRVDSFQHHPPPTIFLKEQLVLYSSICNYYVPVEDISLYVPLNRKHPLFDAFFFEVEGENRNCVVIWIIRMATCKRSQGQGLDRCTSSDGSSESVYEDIHTLRQLVQEQKGLEVQVRVKYVLFVPARKAEVVWRMPSGWDDPTVNGEVFVQYLDLDSMW